MFGHQTTNKHSNGEPANEPSTATERLSPPPQKKRRIENKAKTEPEARTAQFEYGSGRQPPADAQRQDVPKKLELEADPLRLPLTQKTQSDEKISQLEDSDHVPVSASGCKSISPPPLLRRAAPAKVKESLNPRTVPNPPQKHPKRKALLTALHAAMAKLNEQASFLSSDELISMANDEEEHMALTSRDEDSYRTITGQRVMKLRKMGPTEWKELGLGYLNRMKSKQTKVEETSVEQPRGEIIEQPSRDAKKPDKAELPFSTTLTAQQEIALLQHIRTPVEGLAEYVTTPPSEIEISKARMGLDASPGLEVCDRCKSRFTVFPGRNEQGRLTSGGQCKYHWAKLPRFVADATYDCCKEPAGGPPCQTADTHVFKVSDPKRLASICQYARTPSREDVTAEKAIAIDCEMGFTTLGMEMVRLSALSWPKGEVLIDVLVRPFGEVLDLNTKFSGVSLDQFNKAIPYGTQQADHGGSTSEDSELESERLPKVESPEQARQLLFDRIGTDTALIGHAIDNDLNVLRIIHPFVVDTVLLYPHPRGLPARYGLKMLTSKYLHRNIQNQNTGHDSTEDAKATGELVRLKVAGKWRKMQGEGWKLEKDSPVPPEGSEPDAMR